MGNRNAELPSPSIATHSVDKENVSENKVELSKLSVERQQMKRKKKTAGFNLRKSLAWDRAFFTEEGVLDSVELSIITGNDCQTGGEMLPTIQEERRESILASSCSSESPGLRAIEENLFKEFPVSSKKKEKKVAGGILPKNASPSKAQFSLAQRKLLSAQDARSSSKSSGCPRPLASSSLKRPANAHIAKAQNKELRVNKVSATRSDPLKVANTMKKSTQAASKVKQIQSAQSIGNSQRSLGSTSSSKRTSSAQIKTKPSLASKTSIPKPSVKQARRNEISKVTEIPSASNSQHSGAAKSDTSLMTTSDLALPRLGHGSNFYDSSSSNIAVSVPQGSCSSTENMQSAVPRVPRPSGLRMPSPSIGFFSQSKYPSHGSLENSSQALTPSDSATSYSLIPNFKKSQVAGKVPRVNSKTTTGKISSSGSTRGFSAPSGLLQPSQEKAEAGLKSTLEKELKPPCNPISSQIIKSLQHPNVTPDDADKIPLDNAALYKYGKISSEKVEELQSNSKTSPLCSKNNEQEDKTSDGKRDEIKKSCTTEDHSASPLKHGLMFKDSVDSQVQCSSDDKLKAFDNYSQVKVSNRCGGNTCKTNDFNGDLDGLGAYGQPLNAYLLPGNEEEDGICLSGEKDILGVDHPTESVAKQLEISDSCTANPAVFEAFVPTESNVDDLSYSGDQSGDTESVLISPEPAEAQDIFVSPYNHPAESTVSDSIQCGHLLVHDGQAVTQLERTNKVRDSTEASCEADLVDTFPDCRELFRESEDQHFSCQLFPEVKEGEHEMDVMTRNETTNEDDGPEKHIDCLTGSGIAGRNMEQVNLPMSFREFEHRHFSCQLDSEVKEGDHEIDFMTRNETADEDDGSEMHIECLTGSPVAEQNMEQVNLPMPFRDFEDQHFSCQLVSEAKEGDHEIDVMTRNGMADEDDGPEMHIECLTGTPVAEQNMEQVNLPMLFKDFEDEHFPYQVVSEVKEGDHEIDVMTRNEIADEDDGLEMQIDCVSGSLAEQDMEQVNLPTPFSPEVRMEDQTLKPSHDPFLERLTSEEYKQSKCCNIANKSEAGVSSPIEQTAQKGSLDCRSSAHEVTEAVVSWSNEQPEINSVQEGIDLVIDAELISDQSELSATGILEEGFLEVEAIQAASIMSEETNALGTELKSSPVSTSGDPSNDLGTEFNSSPTSNSGDPEPLSKDTDLSRIAECIPKKEPDSSVELNKCVGKAEGKTEIMIRTDNESCAQVTGQELGSHKEEEVPVVRNSQDPEAFATREEESGTPISTDEAVPIGNIMQPNELTVVDADTSISENNGADASESSGSSEVLKESNTYSSEDTDKMSLRDAKLGKRPDPLVVKRTPNAVPFSDEWLAAIEAAGEEILTLKTGPVQHSPPEKPAHEPGPWSPVKRKNNQGVGPFDCTKFTNKGLPPASE